MNSSAAPGPSAQPCHVCLGPVFVEEDKPVRVEPGLPPSPKPPGRILSASRGDSVPMNERDDGRPLRLECRVEKFDFSGHAPRDQVLDFLLKTRPRHTILVHGDAPARRWFADRLQERAPEKRVTIPAPGVAIDL